MENLEIMNLENIYSGKKVFITGHTGFKGAWLLTWLNRLGAIVKGYALAPEDNNLYQAIGGDSMCQSIIADIQDKERLKLEMLSFQPDFIFHLAAQPLVRLSYDLPIETFNINTQGTAHMLEVLRYLEKPCTVVMITTDKVYHNLEVNYYYQEDDKLGGYDPYSASKACAELIISSYRNSFFHPSAYSKHLKSISVARAGNVIGGGDWAKDRIIPDIIRALSTNKAIVVRNPTSVRPWQHVLDPLYGYLLLAAHQHQNPTLYAEAYNFGPMKDDTFTVEELVKEAIKNWGAGSYRISIDPNAAHEAGLLKLDISKSLIQLHWSPQLDARKAIEVTVNWYKQNISFNKSAKKLIEQDILLFSQQYLYV